MKIDLLITKLMNYGRVHNIYLEDDYNYVLNSLLAVFKLDDYSKEDNDEELSLVEILDGMLEYAIENKIIENSAVNKDLFDTKVMGCLTPLPSTINQKFYGLLKDDAQAATNYFYTLCEDINYVRTDRIKKDIHFDYFCEYGTLNISINMSKPEKDPNDIKKLLSVKQVNYPKCMLCIENINYAGRLNFPARQNLRAIPLYLDNTKYYLQYSPYSYYNEHCIVFEDKHENMHIDINVIKQLIDFVEMFPHYFVGSNADLPIVGGSILTHQHFQGGKAILPMQNAKEIFIKKVGIVNIYKLYWPLNVIRLRGNKEDVTKLAGIYLDKWFNYSNKKLNILCKEENERHNTITPICKINNGLYELDLVLRNNQVSEDRPLGIHHPREEYWHIKKENIGLIEVMGLAILPSRLKKEMVIVKDYLLGNEITDKAVLEKHKTWADELKMHNLITKDNVDDIINKGIGNTFKKVMEDCAVFDKEHDAEFEAFIKEI